MLARLGPYRYLRGMRAVFLVLVGGVIAAPLDSQSRPESASLSLEAVAESLAVLRRLDDSLRRRSNRDDPDLWYRRGMLAWALSVRGGEPPPVAGLTWQRYGHMADTSLRTAARLAPERTELAVAAGRYVASVPGVFNRSIATREFEAALAVAESRGDPTRVALALHAIGRAQWQLYQLFHHAERRGVRDAGTAAYAALRTRPDASSRAGAMRPQQDLEPSTPGEFHLLSAERALSRAHAVAPADVAVARDLAALLALGERWDELEEIGRSVGARVPGEAWGPLLKGLAAQRRGRPDAPRRLDDGFALLPNDRRAALVDLSRLMTAADSTSFATLSPAAQAERARWYWLLADPLWSVLGDEPRTEFLARLVQAHLRYSVPDMHVRGEATERGGLLLRWGPPVFDRNDVWNGRHQNGVSYAGGGGAVFSGLYDLRLTQEHRGSVTARLQREPASWANVRSHLVEEHAPAVARFRAAGDSLDVLIGTRIPLERLDTVAHLRGATTVHHWMIRDARDTVVRDSSRVLGGSGYVARRHRLDPGVYAARIEALRDGSSLATRAPAIVVTTEDTVAGFRRRGFGVSDLLLTEVPMVVGPGRRWDDIDAPMIVAEHPRTRPLHLAWEVYEAATTDRGSGLLITVRVEAVDSEGHGGGIVARILGRGSSAGQGAVEVRYAVPVARAPVHLEQFSLDLDQSAPGAYRVLVEVTDAAGRVHRSAASPFRLR